MDKNKINIEDRFMLCKHNVNFFCEIIQHQIQNGIASSAHCRGCSKFELRDKEQNK